MIIYLVTALTILVLLHFMLRNTEQEDAKDESNIRMPAGFEAQLAGWINKFAKEGCERSRNRILALGIAAIPDLLNALIQRRLRPGLNPPTTIARFEQLIGDFGPSALTVIAQQLRNWEPTHRSAPSLIRIARTLKPRQLSQAFVMNSGNDNLCRGYFLNHLIHGRSDIRSCEIWFEPGDVQIKPEFLVSVEKREWATLWMRLNPAQRHALLESLAEWPNLISEAFLEFLLFQAEPAFLTSILQLTTLVQCPTLASTIKELTSAEDIEVKRAAINALSFSKTTIESERLDQWRVSSDPSIRMCYLRVLAIDDESEFKTHEILGMLEKLFGLVTIETATRVDELLLDVIHDESPLRSFEELVTLCVVLPKLLPQPVVGFERLLSLANQTTEPVRVAATLALALHDDKRALEAFSVLIKTPPTRAFTLPLRQAAHRVGAPLARSIVNYLLNRPPSYGHAIKHANQSELDHQRLALLRCCPFEGSCDILLSLIDANSNSALSPIVAMTLRSGNAATFQELRRALQEPERGLLIPMIRYLLLCPDDRFVEDLITVFRQFDIVRHQVLLILEYLGQEGLRALERLIMNGGDDAVLDPVYETCEWLEHCLDASGEFSQNIH